MKRNPSVYVQYVARIIRPEELTMSFENLSSEQRDKLKEAKSLEEVEKDLEIKEPCAELVTVNASSNFVKYSFRTEPKDGETAIFLNGKGRSDGTIKSAKNDLEISLCTQPTWTFSLDMGAADADLDLSPYKVEKVIINGGACDLDLKLGNNGGNTAVDINTGASDIDIKVPMDAYCQINIKSAISGKDFTGFEKMANGQWQTPNLEQASTKIVINMSCAVSDVSVTRY